MIRRYLAVVGVILLAVIALAVWLKPPLKQMRAGVEAALSRYAQARLAAGEAMPAVTQTDSHDWLVASSHIVRAGDLTFYCVGALKVTVCGDPN